MPGPGHAGCGGNIHEPAAHEATEPGISNWGLALGAAAAVALLGFVSLSSERSLAPASETPPSAVPPQLRPPRQLDEPSVTTAMHAVTTHKETLIEQLRNSPDYFALAKSILKRAQSGDAEAQYMLWLVHFECYESGVNFLVQDADGHALRWDETVQKAAAQNLPLDTVKKQYDRCHRFVSEDSSELGDAMQWLQSATDAHYPQAQMQTANLLLRQERLRAAQQATGVTTGGESVLLPLDKDASPRDLLRSAVSSLDPVVIQAIGDMMAALHPTAPLADNKLNRAAWIYVSCQRGADCSFYGEASNSNCAPTAAKCIGVPQRLLDSVNSDWAPVQERVDQINAALDARQWDTLDLGP